ncbi:DUF1329 domain-containing protein [Pseudomonas sp. RTC3]|uniref:DUF1329 domain-containing protein n=1 Tax=Pseudomonas sp. 5C2 TaxID=3048588 RepID=UPI002AB42127|nr:DUF1329 domain-containing protein [Pseudomonas sp. 5C2]MDY7564643.1 DUF1329 domain-containing protein [Pseudomonas sp. 5C2]MEB0060711.1 DUF1329 domain-containing protein [Pseudomonas sp. RTC3]MEB0240830.1 DUF1329 domain-containing protein [Pseudomonas sp. 5C2]
MYKKTVLWAALVASFITTQMAHAAVSADEAAKLKSSLTPLGGEMSANKDGSIPAWSGVKGLSASSEKVGDIPVKLFADEKPQTKITAQNMGPYADKLSEGTQALLKKYPDTFRLDVYPTHRTAAAPQYVYDNTMKNATQCKVQDNGMSLQGCYGGVPFPIPKSGVEAIWNHLLRVESEATEVSNFKNIILTSDGSRAMATMNDQSNQYPYYYKDGSADKWSGEYFLQRFSTIAPPFKAGESLVFRDSINVSQARQAWQYLVGQRRVRRAPTVAYDTPDFVASGANYFDEVMGLMGHVDRYDWKLVGKREMYVPYNTNEVVIDSLDQAYGKHHLNPDKVRWELHRVWEVEATVAAGKRHAVPKRRYYLDEDSWMVLLMDGYDSEGKLWRTTQITPFVLPSVPMLELKPAHVFNLQANTMSSSQSLNEATFHVVGRKPETYFTGDSVGAEGVR